MDREQRTVLYRIIAAGAMLVALRFLGDFPGKWAAFLVPYFLVGYDVLVEAWEGIKEGEPFDECFLMAAATVGAMALGNYSEGVAVMLFFKLGELFEDAAVEKSRRNIAELMDIRPDSAELMLPDGTVETVDPSQVPVGSVIVVRPGGRVPIDGVVTEGSSSLNTAAITGESVPRTVRPGDAIHSGCINLSGLLRVRTTKEFGESTASKILKLMESAAERKSKSENFITKFARIYTPAVCFSALALFLLPPLFSIIAGNAPMWGTWLYRALTFLVISCPCALVISIPLTFFAGLGGASRSGILIKGSGYMETLSKVRCVAFDKTGTMTKGSFEVTETVPVGMEEHELIELLALAESASTHPIAKSIIRAHGAEPRKERVRELVEHSGLGITARVDGRTVAAGSIRLMHKLNIACEELKTPGTVVYAAVDGRYAGYVLISDEIKPGAASAVSAMKSAGVRSTVMLTGDNERVARDTAERLGIDRVFAELLPADKLARVEELLSGLNRNEKLAFVGDGINDAPVLTRADIGIAMGALGSDAAIEAADVVLMDDDPKKLARALGISRRCLRIVYENIVFAIAVKLVCLALGAVGIANMWTAIFADVGVMVIAVLNAIRALRVKGKV